MEIINLVTKSRKKNFPSQSRYNHTSSVLAAVMMINFIEQFLNIAPWRPAARGPAVLEWAGAGTQVSQPSVHLAHGMHIAA